MYFLEPLWNRITRPTASTGDVTDPELTNWRISIAVYMLMALFAAACVPVFAATGHYMLILGCGVAATGFLVAYALARRGHRLAAAVVGILLLNACILFNTYHFGSGLFETAYFVSICVAFLVLEHRRVRVLWLLIAVSLAAATWGIIGRHAPPVIALSHREHDILLMVTLVLVGCAISVVLYYFTAARSAALRMKDALDTAQAAHHAQSSFLANMSHELRTPMNGVLGMLGILEQTSLTEEQRDCLRTAHKSGQDLLRILNDILDLSKVEAGELQLSSAPFNLRTLVEEVARHIAAQAAGKELEIVVHVPPDTPEHVAGDAGRLRQVLLNLSNNAVKFTEKGHILISVRHRQQDDAHAQYRLSIADTGIGLSTHDQTTIFEKFKQVNGSGEQAQGGTGLGLAIVQQFVQLMGGRVGIESEPNRGSEFWFEVPLPIVPPDPGLSPSAKPDTRADSRSDEDRVHAAATVDLRDVRVLLAEPHPAVRQILIELLVSWGIRVDSCATCLAVQQYARRAAEAHEPYQLILIADKLLDVNGKGAIRALQSDPSVPNAPAILLADLYRSTSRSSAASVRLSARVSKPICRDELLEILSSVWRAVQDGDALPNLMPSGVSGPIQIPRLPISHLRVLIVEDNPVNQKVAVRILQQLECVPEVADSGAEALRLLELEGRSYDLVLMDVQMPGMDGLQATAAIRAWERTTGQRVPIIALTAHAMEGDRQRFLDAGMDDYLSKPIRRDELTDILTRLVSS